MATADASRVTARGGKSREGRMTLGAHLIELRRRFLISAAALVVAMIVAFFIADPIIDLLTEPIREIAARRGIPNSALLNFGTITGGFDFRLRMAFSIGIFLAAPVLLYQIWAFIMPGLTRKEVRYTIGFLCAAIPLFFAGCYAGWIVMPHIIELMSTFVPEGGVNFFDYREYYDFIFKLLLVIGVAFVLPVLLVLLNFAGVMSGKAILKAWRWAILAITLFTAMATPAADVVSMFLLAIPMVGLYFAAVLVAIIHDRRVAKRLANDPVLGSLS